MPIRGLAVSALKVRFSCSSFFENIYFSLSCGLGQYTVIHISGCFIIDALMDLGTYNLY